ncbi:DUF6301 family protein [Actinoplanes sp. L3-i22]|uniref:DUF6301 family protein n=1 Tax=Actinoplanes sp. L3-i22 TaxID=2836373 RepID=UPI001C797831|nr:DUF6301 family protein [Actinoplanes sp. L3-i22]BCY09237.1 hypothetical protein L3i22_043250 [Actinoplanes sp. L3-i22]
MTFTRTDDATVHQMLAALRDADWSWRVEDVDALVARLGWRLTERWDNGAEAELPWALPERMVPLVYWSDGVSQVFFDLTARTANTPQTAAAADDAFADFTAMATGILGSPVEATPGENPTVVWRTAASTFTMMIFLDKVVLNWSSNAYQRFQDEVDAAGSAGFEAGE